MYILGISCYYHDSAASLLKDGKVVAAAEEERFTRKKHDKSFPVNAIKYCLKSQGISISQVESIAFYEKPLIKFERVLYQHLEAFPFSLKTFLSALPSWINEKLRLIPTIRKKLNYKGDVMFVDHHMAHAASSFLVSPFKKSAILTIDGVGEWSTTTKGIGIENKITLTDEIRFPSSIGLIYSTVTAYLGFSVNNSEYKVMGLAPYGDMNKETNPYFKKLLKVVDIKNDGSFRLDLDYFSFHYKDRMPSNKFCNLLGGPSFEMETEVTQKHMDIAAGVQLLTEHILTKILNSLCEETKCENLVLAGGVALNSVYNGKILRNTKFKNIWIQPNASDGGGSLGAAAYVYYSIFNKKRGNYVQKTAYLGPGYTDNYIANFIKEKNIKIVKKFSSDKELTEDVAELLSNNGVIGWFQGRMEWGPRALGARSILASPLNSEAKELLNTKVKHREKFRPFAPVVCADDADTYFDCDKSVPEPTDYMLMVYPVRKKYWSVIPSVTHVDGSGRLQTIRKEQNPRYYGLLKEFGKLKKVPILINTSFNIRGEPIVCSPEDAYRCMMGTGIDYLVLGSYLIKREDNPKDMWDSESLAID